MTGDADEARSSKTSGVGAAGEATPSSARPASELLTASPEMSATADAGYRAALGTALGLNLLMAVGEGGVGWWIGSAALVADAADFTEDVFAYALALVAVGWSLRGRAAVGVVQALAMAAVGFTALYVGGRAVLTGVAPEPVAMGLTAILALGVNLYCAFRLAAHRRGDASRRSIWLSTRNDAVLNIVTLLAAFLVGATGSFWPDVLAAALIAVINLWAAWEVLTQAADDWRGRTGRGGA